MTAEVSAGQFLIPFMFVFDFIKRNRTIRQYTQRYMHLREVALDAAAAIYWGSDREQAVSQAEKELGRERSGHCLSDDVFSRRAKVVKLLIDLYAKMLDTDENDYAGLIRDVYPSREDYERHLCQLTLAETEADRLLLEMGAASEDRRKAMASEHRHLETQREKDLAILY